MKLPRLPSPDFDRLAQTTSDILRLLAQVPVFWSLIAYLLASLITGTMGWYYTRHFFSWAVIGGISAAMLVQLVWGIKVLLKRQNDI